MLIVPIALVTNNKTNGKGAIMGLKNLELVGIALWIFAYLVESIADH